MQDEDTQDKKGVDIEELLKNEEIDALSYMGWEPLVCPPGYIDEVCKCQYATKNKDKDKLGKLFISLIGIEESLRMKKSIPSPTWAGNMY